MAKIYLETSFFSACVSTRTDPASLSRRQISQTWWTLHRHQHRLFISAEVIEELSQPTYPNCENALQMTVGIELLPIDALAIGFAKILVQERVMPGPEGSGDALHVAVATVHTMKHILSWNVRHLANVNKVEHLNKICMRIGYLPPIIITPDVLWPENETGD